MNDQELVEIILGNTECLLCFEWNDEEKIRVSNEDAEYITMYAGNVHTDCYMHMSNHF